MRSPLDPGDTFPRRHFGPREADLPEMLGRLGLGSLAELARAVVPADIFKEKPLSLDGLPERPLGEAPASDGTRKPSRPLLK